MQTVPEQERAMVKTDVCKLSQHPFAGWVYWGVTGRQIWKSKITIDKEIKKLI